MIVTVTPNPSLDRTLEVDGLRRGEGGQLVGLLTEQGLTPVVVPITGHVRANVTIVEPDGTVTKVDEPGPTLDGDEIERLLATLAGGHGATWVVGSGSLPPGCPIDLFAAMTERAHEGGSRVVIDSSGAPLAAALAAHPDLVKPNLEELARVGDGDVVVVMGAGPIGCLHVRLARSLGASTVYLIDVNADRLALSADRVHPGSPRTLPTSAATRTSCTTANCSSSAPTARHRTTTGAHST